MMNTTIPTLSARQLMTGQACLRKWKKLIVRYGLICVVDPLRHSTLLLAASRTLLFNDNMNCLCLTGPLIKQTTRQMEYGARKSSFTSWKLNVHDLKVLPIPKSRTNQSRQRKYHSFTLFGQRQINCTYFSLCPSMLALQPPALTNTSTNSYE